MDKKFSVVMSVYKLDDPIHFEQAIKSIWSGQTRKPDEIVLVVDGEVSDIINKIIDKFKTEIPGFNVYRYDVNKGLGEALRLGVEKAKFDLIARMDSDDISVSNRFEQQLAFLNENKDVDVVGGNILEFAKDVNNIVGRRLVCIDQERIQKDLKRRCPFNHMTIMFKKKAVINSGNYVSWHFNEDYYLWIRMYLNGARFANLDTVLVYARVDNGLYGRRGGLKYFLSEFNLQKFMLSRNVIGINIFVFNILKRFVFEVCLPARIRALFYKSYFRNLKFF